ncbi:hyccin-like [Saccoglossus kowalevskii]
MATMEQRMLQEWIAECKSLSRAELSSYGRMLKEQKEITEAIYGVFQQPDNELRDSICGQLFEFYRSGDSECRRFCLQYIPSILYYYLTPSNKNKSLDRLEALLLGIYNLDVVEVDGRQKVKTCIIPTLAKPSIYHEPVHLSSVALTESALSSHQKKETQLIKSGPFPQEKIITAQNRFSILSHVLYIYNTGIACMKGTSHEILCKMCSHLCTTGYTKQSLTPQTNGSLSTSTLSDSTSLLTNGYPEYQPRVHLSPEFMIEMLTGVYYVMFNGHQKSGREALENIHYVACQQLLSEVILVTSAIKNSLSSNPSGQPADGPIGISIALTPSTPTFTRAAITNASFKARRVSRASGK